MGLDNKPSKFTVFLDGKPIMDAVDIDLTFETKEKATCKIPLNYNVSVTFRPTWRFRLWLWWIIFKGKVKWWKENRHRGT